MFDFSDSPIGLAICALWFFFIVQFVQRISAAQIAAALPTMKVGERRRFGMPPFNVFEYRGSLGWDRIKKIERGGPIYDHLPTEARRYTEYEEKKRRRIAIGKSLAIAAIDLAIIKAIISPLPFSIFLHIFDFHNIYVLYTAIVTNVAGLNAWLVQAAQDSVWKSALDFLDLVELFVVPFFLLLVAGSIFIEIVSIPSLFKREALYQLGFQWIKGAKVFDARPTDPADSPREEHHRQRDDSFSSNKARQDKQKRRGSQPPPDDDDPFRSGGGTGARQQQSERDPAKNFQDALWLFELTEDTLTPESLQAAYKKKTLAHHPDRWNDISERTRRQLEDDLKIINAARDLIKKYKGWK